MTRVLVVEDEPQLVRALEINLRAREYEVESASDGGTGLRLAAARAPDVVLLDLGLPDMDGINVIKALRHSSRVPILVVSARQSSDERITALDAGADDYITKPFDMSELVARLRAAARRAERAVRGVRGVPVGGTSIVSTDEFTVDLLAKRARRHGQDVRLTPTEWQLLEVLIRHRGRLVGQRQLLHEVWGTSYDRQTNHLRVYMAQLRRKLEADPSHPRYLITSPGMGYRFEI
ncbi:response regulator [Streptomyces sp. NPDC058653]|uniref:response regulator n=1 Tax=Streptomyces sp. NPDC058653 TaxID=3346576 RepID=UPI00364D49FD